MPSKVTPQFELKTLMTGLAMGESPRWHDGRLWFSDWGLRKLSQSMQMAKVRSMFELSSVCLFVLTG